MFIKRLAYVSCMMILPVFTATGCIKTTEERGYVSKFTKWNEVQKGISTRDDVVRLMGSPSTQSTYGKETWYYISTTAESVAFASPTLVDQNVWYVTFNETGVVENTGTYSIEDARDIAFAKDKTTTEGNDFTVTQQLLGNLGRFNPKDDKVGN